MGVLDSKPLWTFSKNVAGDLFANKNVAIYTFLKYLAFYIKKQLVRDFTGALPIKQCSIFVVNTLIKQRFIICEYLHEPY